VLDLVIREDGDDLYSGTIADFFDAGQVSLSSVAGSGGSTEYDFTISFAEGAGNPYQEVELGFDIVIGFAGEEGGGEDEGGGDNGGDGGGGGGGNGPPRALTIRNEASIDVTDTTANIFWNTSYESTSRVIYGTTPDLFNFSNPPNYGYPFSSAEFDTPANINGITTHSVTITGLNPSTTYYYRIISHASPDTVSYEYGFETLVPSPFSQDGEGTDDDGVGTETNTQGENILGSNTNEESSGFGGEIDSESEEVVEGDENVTDTSGIGGVVGALFGNGGVTENEENNENGDNNFLQGALSIFGLDSGLWIIIILGLIIFIILFLWRKKKKKKRRG